MTLQTVTLAGKKFVILPEREYQRMSKAIQQAAAHDNADIRLAKRRLSDRKEKPIPYSVARRELGLV